MLLRSMLVIAIAATVFAATAAVADDVSGANQGAAAAPKPHHIVLEKSQPSLFIDTPLDLRLKTLGVDTLIMTGVATDIGIEFTCRHAAALGYFSVVIEDATGSYSRDAHERSIAFLRGWTTPVVSAQDACDLLTAR